MKEEVFDAWHFSVESTFFRSKRRGEREYNCVVLETQNISWAVEMDSIRTKERAFVLLLLSKV